MVVYLDLVILDRLVSSQTVPGACKVELELKYCKAHGLALGEQELPITLFKDHAYRREYSLKPTIQRREMRPFWEDGRTAKTYTLLALSTADFGRGDYSSKLVGRSSFCLKSQPIRIGYGDGEVSISWSNLRSEERRVGKECPV